MRSNDLSSANIATIQRGRARAHERTQCAQRKSSYRLSIACDMLGTVNNAMWLDVCIIQISINFTVVEPEHGGGKGAGGGRN